jgi:hypothetical protein
MAPLLRMALPLPMVPLLRMPPRPVEDHLPLHTKHKGDLVLNGTFKGVATV